MKRLAYLVALVLLAAAPAAAQIGKHVVVRAGTPEDRALTQIYNTSDPAAKLALIEKFIAEFGADDSILLGYDLLMTHYMETGEFAKVFDIGEKALAYDPDNFTAAYRMFRTAQTRNDSARMFRYAERIAAIVERFKQRPPPQGTDADTWAEMREAVLEEVAGSIGYVEYSLFMAVYQTADAAQRAALAERFLEIFPASQYAENARAMAIGAYQATGDFARMVALAERVLAREENNVAMLLLLADLWSERGEQLDKAEALATRALAQLESGEKPAALTDEQWAAQKSFQTGLLQSVLGQVHVHANRNAEAVAAFRAAAPLLASDATAYARNQYRLGYTLAKMNRMAEARVALREAIAIESPYRSLAQQTLNQIGTGPAPKKRP